MAQGSPIFNSSCEGELGIAHESLYGKRDLILACVQDLMFLFRGDRDFAVAFQTHPGSQALSLGVGSRLGSLGAEQAEVSGMEGQEALGPGTFAGPLSAATQCFLHLSTQDPGGFRNCGRAHSPPQRRLALGRLWGHRGSLTPGPCGRGSSPEQCCPRNPAWPPLGSSLVF